MWLPTLAKEQLSNGSRPPIVEKEQHSYGFWPPMFVKEQHWKSLPPSLLQQLPLVMMQWALGEGKLYRQTPDQPQSGRYVLRLLWMW